MSTRDAGCATVIVRPAVAADDGVLGDLRVEACTTQYARKLPHVVLWPERLADLRNLADKREHGTVVVAELESRVVGTVVLYRWGSPRSEAWIPRAANLRYLAIKAEHQGRGLSSALTDRAEQVARNWNVPAICLHVRRGVAGVARLYERRGYLRDEAGDIDHLPQIYLEAYVLR